MMDLFIFLKINRILSFLYYIFYSEQPYIGLGKMGTQLNLNTDTVGAIKIPIPPTLRTAKKLPTTLTHKPLKLIKQSH